MRDDLISRKETERILRAYADDVGCNRGEYVLANGILKAVSRVIDPEIVPTAYDVGKVIECFEKERNFLFDENGRCYSAREKITIDKAIEIVKSGGVADE